MLVPTDFRKKPIKFTKRFYSNNWEISTFRVTGKEVKLGDVHSKQLTTIIETDVLDTGCEVSLQLRQNGEWVPHKSLSNIRVQTIESLNGSYCISLLSKINSCVIASCESTISLTDVKEEIDAIRINVKSNEDSYWTHDISTDSSSHIRSPSSKYILYAFCTPSSLDGSIDHQIQFNSKGLRRITNESIVNLYTDPQRLSDFIKQLMNFVQDREQLGYIRDTVLQHLNRINLTEHQQTLKESFKFSAFFDDPNLIYYSDHFKATIFRTLNKIGIEKAQDLGMSFSEYTSQLLKKIQDKGIDNFDICTMHFIYMTYKDLDQDTFKENYDLLTKFIFAKALPELDKTKKYQAISFNTSLQNHINAGTLLIRAGLRYELTTDLTTIHSISYLRLLFDQNTAASMFYLKIKVYAVDKDNKETLLIKTSYGDDVYKLLTKKAEVQEFKPAENSNCLTISLSGIPNRSRYYRIKINHVETYLSKNDCVQEPRNAIVPLYYGQDTGDSSPVNGAFKALKSDINLVANRLEDVLSINGIDFHVYEKGGAYFSPKFITKKELKNLKDYDGSRKLLAAKRNEQIELIKSREYSKANELAKEITQIKNRFRSKQPKVNNITFSELLVLAADIMNYICPEENSTSLNKFEGGISQLTEDEKYDLLKNIVEWFLLPKDNVLKVVSLKPAYKIIRVVLKNIPNANGVFFDMIEKLLKKKSYTHKKIFQTLHSLIKDMEVNNILSEMLNRFNVDQKIEDITIDSPKVLTEIATEQTKVSLDKEKMWIIVGTLQLLQDKLHKIPAAEKPDCLSKVLVLGTLRFKASEYELTMYYKLVLKTINDIFKEKNSDQLLSDPSLLLKIWFNILTLSTDPDIYSMILKLIEEVMSSAINYKKKANDLVHHVLVWYSDINTSKEQDDAFKGTIFEGLYDNNQELFSTHYCQSIDLFLGTFRSDAEDSDSNELVSEIFNNIMSALNKPSKSASFAKIWNELFKCLAIIGSNENNVNKFVTTFLSLPGEIQDNLYTHFDIDNVNLDSTKTGSRKFTVKVIYKILRCMFRHGLKDTLSEKDQLRVYTICDDLICKLATTEPCDVNVSKNKTPVTFTNEEYVETLHLFNEYLNCYLNKGYYSHMAGASYVVLSRLKMGVHLSYLVYNSEINGKKCHELFLDEFEHIPIEEKADILEKQVIWLLLNHSSHKGKSDPCSIQHQRINKAILENLPKKKEVVLVLLPKIMKQVIKFDNMILNNCQKLGFERSSALQNNSNAIISSFFNVCLNDKDLFNDFLVKMKGFDFFLQRLFTKSDTERPASGDEEELIHTLTSEENKEPEKIENLFEDPPKPTEKVDDDDQNKKDDKNKEKKSIDKVNLTDAGKTMKLIQSTVGVENQTQDWVLYKNGQRNRIVFKHIDKSCKSDFIMKFECTEVIEVSDVTMGLIYYWGNYDQDMHYEPMQVFCEGGLTKSQIDWSVPLRLADDGGYRQSAVNVYGANFSNFNSMNYDHEKYCQDPHSIIVNKIKEKKDVFRAKYITFRLRRPEICCLESSMFNTVLTKTMSYGFTFFSVQGIYPDNYFPLKNALLDVQKENTLEILSQFCSGSLSDTFSVIANDQEVIEGFKKSITKLSQLLDQKEYLIKPIFIALCSQNSEMADWIIDKFLDTNATQKQIRLLGEIIKQDKDQAISRIMKLLKFIFDHIDSEDTKSIESLSDVIEIFLTNAINVNDEDYEDEVKITYELDVIDLMLDKTVECSDEVQELVLSFIIFLFEPPKPFKNAIMSPSEIVEYLLKVEDDDSEDRTSLKLRLASTLCASSQNLAKIILSKDSLLQSYLNIDTNELSVWKSKTRFWYNCAQEQSVKSYLAEKQVAQKVFNNFRKFFGPGVEESNADIELNEILVSFVSTVTAGNDLIETEIASILKEDLKSSCETDRLDYLNSIIVPLLHMEKTIPVTISVGDKSSDGSKTIYRPIYYKPADATSESKFLFKTSVLSKSQESAMMKMFKEHVSEYHDQYDKLISKKWTLIAEDDVPKKGDFQKISDKISDKANTLHLIRCTINGEQAVFGGF